MDRRRFAIGLRSEPLSLRWHRAMYPRHLVYKRVDMIRIAVKARELTDIMGRID